MILALFCAGILSACTTPRKPCSLGGDTDWDGRKFGGDKKCRQVQAKDGLYYNEGPYREYHRTGQIALEGEFKNGRKHGTWTEYDASGAKALVRTYEDGVQKTSESLKRPPGAK